jgi:antitoxin MazE
MLASVISIGNSRGIRIPQSILTQLNFNDKVEMEVQDNKLVLSRVEKEPRKGWEKAFSETQEPPDVLIADMIDNDTFEWEW